MSEQPDASRRRAVALHYDRDAASEDASAPRIVAKGAGCIADRILELAHEHGVPIREDRDLLAMLSACDLDDEVPPELFGAVAELLAWLYRCNADYGEVRHHGAV